jgi:hypothetical protein
MCGCFIELFDKSESGAAPVAHTPPSCPVLYNFLGHLGKAFFPLSSIFSFLLPVVLSLVGCGLPGGVSRNLGTGETLAISEIERRWAGPVIPLEPSCGHETIGLMSIGAHSFGFDPFQSTTVIQGVVDGGALRGTLTRTGGNKQVLSISFDGQAGKDDQGRATIIGTLSSGRCRWHVALKRG